LLIKPVLVTITKFYQEFFVSKGKSASRALAMGAGPVVAAAIWVVLATKGLRLPACWTAAITGWCAVWWIFEPVPIAATSILPFAIFPLSGVLDHNQVARGYGDTVILLFMGGFMLAQGLEKSGAHRRLALGMVRAVGGKGGRRLVLGFLLAAVVISMWISNTTTTLILLPIAAAVLEQADENEKKRLAIPLMLALCYGASIGGIGTPIGTPPNMIFIGMYGRITGKEFGFFEWMKIGVPIMVIMFFVAWLWLVRRLGEAKAVKIPTLGPWRAEERRVMTIFALAALGWIFRGEPYGGWTGLINAKGIVGDSTVALIAVILLFVWPDGKGGRLLDLKTAMAIPWDILLLFGGGLTIAEAFEVSGLSKAIGDSLAVLSSWPMLAMMVALTLSAGFLTNIMSNTAMAALLMPLLGAAAKAAEVEPAMLMIPTVISISFAFMLPIGTPPNAIIYGAGKVSVRDMVREGFMLNLVGVIVVTVICYLLLPVFIKV
jgi:sodium-dependent dicarboxylate transporter 2/3/5